MARTRASEKTKGSSIRASSYRIARSSRTTSEKRSKLSGSLVQASSGDANDVQLTQTEISQAIKCLKLFDLTTKFGPFVGLSRTARWRRAQQFGLDPPPEILKVLNDIRHQQSIPDVDLDLFHNEGI